MEEILLDVFGLRVQVNTPLLDFAEFVRNNYHIFLNSSSKTSDIVVTYSSDAGKKAAEVGHRLYNAGMGVYIDQKKLYWENEFGFRVLVTLKDKCNFYIQAFHNDLLHQQDIEKRHQNFQRSMRWTIHFPIFSLLQKRQGWVLVHASAVAQNEEALIFCGLNKVGKSTLAMYFYQEQGYKFMTDNFLLADSQYVYGFPEVMRLSPEAMERLVIHPQDDHKIYGKYHMRIDSSNICLKAHPRVCYFVTQGEKLELTKLDSDLAWRTIKGIHSFLGEFPESSYLALMPFLKQGSFEKRLNSPVISKNTTWFHLSIPLDWNLRRIVEVIEKCI